MFSDKRQKTRLSSPPAADCNVWLTPSFPAHDYIHHPLLFPDNYGSSSGKTVFTASQLQEFERQKLIHTYITSSVTVPPHLLSGFGSRNPVGSSDLEPWRCKRTDGKKWRCSRDVAAPDQKYCDRHAHKSKPRSRKHVEINPHNNNDDKSPNRPIPASPYQPPKPRSVDWEWAAVETSSSSAMAVEDEESSGMTKMPLWMNGHGGPLGEALLCLGNARGTCGGWNSASPQRR